MPGSIFDPDDPTVTDVALDEARRAFCAVFSGPAGEKALKILEDAVLWEPSIWRSGVFADPQWTAYQEGRKALAREIIGLVSDGKRLEDG